MQCVALFGPDLLGQWQYEPRIRRLINMLTIVNLLNVIMACDHEKNPF